MFIIYLTHFEHKRVLNTVLGVHFYISGSTASFSLVVPVSTILFSKDTSTSGEKDPTIRKSNDATMMPQPMHREWKVPKDRNSLVQREHMKSAGFILNIMLSHTLKQIS